MPPMIKDPFGGRSIPEWIASKPDTKVPDKVRDRVLERAGGRCHLSGMLIAGKPWQVEHVRPLSMGGEHRESNLAPALVEAHREKTSLEARDRAKADRMRRKANNTWPKPKKTLRSRGFENRRDAR